MVISTPTVSYNTPLVWYAHFIFYSVRIIHGILLDKLVEEPAESKKEETFAMPRHRKHNDR